MNAPPRETLRNLFGKDLAGWEAGNVFTLEVKHVPWGSYPAIVRREGTRMGFEVVVVSNPRLLQKAYKCLYPYRCEITPHLAVVNAAENKAFLVGVPNADQLEPIRVFSESDLDAIIDDEAGDSAFRWMPGFGFPEIGPEPNWRSATLAA